MSGTYEVTEVTKRKGIPAWWVTVFLFWLGWVFMYADLTVLNPVMGELEKEFGLSGTQLGVLNSEFYLCIAAGAGGDPRGQNR